MIPGLGRSLGVGNGNPPQYFCLSNPMDSGTRQVTVQGIEIYLCTPFIKSSLTFAVQSLSHVRLLATPWTAASQDSLSFTIPQSLLKLMSIESVMPSNHLILCHPFSSCPQSFPISGSFPMSWLFTSRDQRNGPSASAPMNIQG